MLNTPFSPWLNSIREEADVVSKVLLPDKVNHWVGTEHREFGKEFAAFVGTQYVVALSNDTLTLDVTLKAMDIGVSNDIIVTSHTFLASASCIVIADANPMLAGVDLNSQNVGAETIKAALTSNTKAVIVVHPASMFVGMDGIMDLAKEHDFWVIEDHAQVHGVKYKGKSVGSIRHAGTQSFCQDKIMATGGEDDMVTTNDKELWSKMWSYKDHGRNYDTMYHHEHVPSFCWLYEGLGTNWRMTEMQAVIGRTQFRRMPEWTAHRQTYTAELAENLSKFVSVRLIKVVDYIEHAQYKLYAFVKPEHPEEGWTRDRIANGLDMCKVSCCQGGRSEVYLEKALDSTLWWPKERLKDVVELGSTSLMFLVYPTLTDDEITFCKKHVEAVLAQVTA